MKILFKYNIILVLLFGLVPFLANAKKVKHKQNRNITKSFLVDRESEVVFSHRRGELTVIHVDENEARVEATVTVIGEDANDVQNIIDAIEIDIDNIGNRTAINTADIVKYWSTSNNFFWSRHKLVLKSGIEITSKVEQITIDATLYLPKVKVVSLSSRYDDILIKSCQAEKLNVDIRSGELKTGLVSSSTYVKVKYGKLDMQQLGDFILDAHDSKGSVGNVKHLTLMDKYSEFTLGNVSSLKAELHDSDIFMGNVAGDAKIVDKYSDIKLGNMKNGDWDLHDSDITIENADHLRIRTKYTNFKMKDVASISLNAHDDDFNIDKVGEFEIADSKYSDYDIGEVSKHMDITSSHDDDFRVDRSGAEFCELDFNGKYTNLTLPLPSNIGYKISGNMKYGDFKYPKDGLKETRYIKEHDSLEIEAEAADGAGVLDISIEAHDCKINLEN